MNRRFAARLGIFPIAATRNRALARAGLTMLREERLLRGLPRLPHLLRKACVWKIEWSSLGPSSCAGRPTQGGEASADAPGWGLKAEQIIVFDGWDVNGRVVSGLSRLECLTRSSKAISPCHPQVSLPSSTAVVAKNAFAVSERTRSSRARCTISRLVLRRVSLRALRIKMGVCAN